MTQFAVIEVYRCIPRVPLTHHGLVDVVLQGVDKQIPHGLPRSFGLLCLSQPQVELVHGALQLLKALQGLVHLTLPATYVAFQTLPTVPQLARLFADSPGQTTGLLLWSQIW